MSKSEQWYVCWSLLCFDICERHFRGKWSQLENLLNHGWHTEANLFNYLNLCYLTAIGSRASDYCCIQRRLMTMRRKQEGGEVAGGLTQSSGGLEGKPHSPTSFYSWAVKKQLPLRLCSGETDSNYSFLLLPTSFSACRESHSKGKPRERHTPPSLLLQLTEKDIHVHLLVRQIVYFEWCAIMTVQQINATQVLGKHRNFGVIQCKLLILSGESCNIEA